MRRLAALALLAGIALLATATLVASAQAEAEMAKALIKQWKYLSAALAMSISALASGYALAKAGSAASAAAAERPEVAGRLLIYLVLGEGIAIYGLLVAILLIFAG